MTECRGRLEAVSALVDGELSPEEELDLRRHVDACEVCAAWRRQLEALSAGVAASLGRERAPRALTREIERLAPKRGRLGIVAASLVAAIAAAAVLVILLQRAELASGLFVDDHRKLVSGRTALAVPSSDPGEVARGLGERLPFQIEVEQIAGAELRGGHDCTLRGRRAAYLQYERRGEPVSVFVLPGSVRTSARADSCERIGGESLCAFAGLHETVAVVASSNEAAQAFRTAAHVVARP
jgi:anti-sigma factor RsiW